MTSEPTTFLHELAEPEEPVVEEGDGPTVAPAGSVLEAVLARRDEQLAERVYDAEVPGYNGQLLLRLTPLAPGVLARITGRAEKMRPGFQRDFAANADLLIAGCQEVLGRRTPDGEPEPLIPGETLRIDHELARVLRMNNPPTARAVLLELFGKANDPHFAIGGTANEFTAWCGTANEDVDEDGLLGESRATRE